MAQRHPLLVLPAHQHGGGERRRRALLALRLRFGEVRPRPGRGAVRGRRPPEAVGVFAGGGQEEVRQLVEELVGAGPLPVRELHVVGGAEPGAVEHARFMVVQPQRLELGGGSAHIEAHGVRGLVPLGAPRRQAVGRRRAVRGRAVVESSVSREPRPRRDVALRRGPAPSPLGAVVLAAAGLLPVVTLSDLVDGVGGHRGRGLHAGHAVTRLAAGVFRGHAVPLPAGGGGGGCL